MMASMRAVLNVCCGFTILASCWLAVMSVVLRHPGYQRGVSQAVLFIILSLLTLAVTTARLSAAWWRSLAVLGAAALVWAGGSAVAATLSGPHFEGYALLIGASLVLQGLLTAVHLIPALLNSSSKVHQFGN
jgi:hypothetical protein